MTAGKRAAVIVVAAALACAAGFGGYKLYKKFSGDKAKKSEKVFVQKVSSVNTVTGADLFSNSFAGVIVAQKSVDVKYDTSKTIDEILVSEGDQVAKGDKLLTYNVEAIQLEIDTAKLEVEKTENDIKTNEDEIKKLEAEKKTAGEDAAVSYTTQILSLQSDNARSEYDVKAKKVEIQKLEASLKNAYVTAPIDGIVKELKEPGAASMESEYYDYSDGADVIMKISANGDYRVKGIFNEQNAPQIYNGAPVILKSRVDDTTWSGEISEIDTSPQQNSGYDMYSDGEEDEQTSSSKYAFYVSPESLDGFMLGQHILIELDNGQSAQINKTGIWLYEDFIKKDGSKSYVWAKSKKGTIEKRYVELGEKDEEYGDVEIVSGLEKDDYIAYPAKYIKEGMGTTTNQSDKDIPENELYDDEGYGEYDEEYGEDYEDYDFEDFDYDEGFEEDVEYDDEGNPIFTDEDGSRFTFDEEGNVVYLDDETAEDGETDGSPEAAEEAPEELVAEG